MPRRRERLRAGVVGLLRVEVEPRRLVDDLDDGQRRRAANANELVEYLPHRAVRSLVLGADLVPPAVVVLGVAGEHRGYVRVLQLEWVARHDPHPRPPRLE